MDVSGVTNIIGSLGFPIVMCLLLWLDSKKREEQHKEEMDKLSESLQNNTLALITLSTQIETIAKFGETHDKDTNGA